MAFRLETERLFLREYTLADAANLLEMNSDPEVVRYLPDAVLETEEEAAKIIQHIHNQYRQNGYARWATFLKGTGEHIGWCGLKYRAIEGDERGAFTDIGYRFAKRYWGQGFATEAASVCLNYGFNTLNLAEIVGCAEKENLGSLRVLEKLGFQFVRDFRLHGKLMAFCLLKKHEFKL